MDESYVFTFGSNHALAGKAVLIKGTYTEAREKMCENFGDKWAFQYSSAAWDEMKKDPKRYWPMEEIIKEIK